MAGLDPATQRARVGAPNDSSLEKFLEDSIAAQTRRDWVAGGSLHSDRALARFGVAGHGELSCR
jgi:hypothetical protein